MPDGAQLGQHRVRTLCCHFIITKEYKDSNILMHHKELVKVLCKSYAKQKHPRCKKSEAKSEAPVSFYSYMRLKSVISGGGQGPSCLLATMYGQLHIN